MSAKDIDLSALINLMPEHVYWKDLNGVVLGCNVKQANSYGFRFPSDLIGKTDFDLLPKHQAKHIREMDKRVISSGEEISAEEIISLADGSEACVVSKKVPLRNKQGDIIGIIGISIDVTREKELEDQVEKANKTKATFLKVINRIVRSFLNPVLLSAEMMKFTKLNVEQKRMLENITASAEKIVPTLDRVNYYLDIESGEIENYGYIFNLRSHIMQKYELFKSIAEQKNLDFKVVFDDRLPEWVSGNVDFLGQCLSNVLNNALKYTQKGKVEIIVENTGFEFHRVNVVIKVKDTGIGIEKNKLKGLFDIFETDDDSSTFTKPGISLSISKKMLEQVEGNIELNSVVNKGTEAMITLPLEVAEKPDFVESFSYQKSEDISSPEMNERNKKRIHVLVVEDDIISRTIIENAIDQEFNANVVTAETIKDAAKVLSTQYDIILLDMNLPDGTGLEFLEIMQKNKKNIDTPVVAMTAYTTEEERSAMAERGARDIVLKPIPYDMLISIVNYYSKSRLYGL